MGQAYIIECPKCHHDTLHFSEGMLWD